MVIRDFRSISGEWEIPLDADVVLVHGQNGAGKTSLLSALELGATGGISHLDRTGDLHYREFLHNRWASSGEVIVETEDLADRNRGKAFVSGSGIECDPLLQGRLLETFVERCLLPQATLGRLLEVYTSASSGESSGPPLVRFVQDLFGLDSLDSLIEGLHAAGHVSRMRRLSRNWQDAEALQGELRRRQQAVAVARDEARGRVDVLTLQLSSRLGSEDFDADPRVILEKVDSILATSTPMQEQTARLYEMALRLDGIEAALIQADLFDVDPNVDRPEVDVDLRRARFEEWSDNQGFQLRAWFEGSRVGVGGNADQSPATMLRALRAEITDIETSIADIVRRLSELAALQERSRQLRDRLAASHRALSDLDESQSASGTSAAASALASLLVSVLEHIDGDVCPVCDQSFTGGTSLEAHILAKAGSLDADAARLLEVESQRRSHADEVVSVGAEFAEVESLISRLGSVEKLTLEKQVSEAHLHDLRQLEPIGEAGVFLGEQLDLARDAEANRARTSALLDSCLVELVELASKVGEPLSPGLIPQRIAGLRSAVRRSVDDLEVNQRGLAELSRSKRELEEVLLDLARIGSDVLEIELLQARNLAEIEEAKRRKEVGARLLRDAETLRTSTIARVFNARLNGVWSRVFGALVPSEPYVPQFKQVPQGLRQVRVDLETVDRQGKEAATPAAMLSQGNLNTAALSLFVALHFAVPAELPWLIFDDPVQSMDDLHVSNFAALVKQLTRRNGRQVVIAVHERELFDYLALELTPGSPSQRLITVELERTYASTLITHKRIGFTVDTALETSPAA